MTPAQTCRPLLALPDHAAPAAALRRWLQALVRLYGRSVLVESHR